MSDLVGHAWSVSNHLDLCEHVAGLTVDPDGNGFMSRVQVEPEFERDAREDKP